jgi:uncharacterized protein (TIGR00299 family) protein
MAIAAVVGAGVPLAVLEETIAHLGLATEVQLQVETVRRQGQAAIAVTVQTREQHHHRHLPEIEDRIRGAQLSERARDWSLATFRALAIAEGEVHGIPVEQVHFHEVGALDAIVDVVGTCVGLDWLGVEAVCCSALPVGAGYVHCDHGRLPVPVPAVLKLWESRQVPLYDNGLATELVTPTGAALMVAIAEDFGGPPPLTLEKIGLGAGHRDLPIPNILRLWVGTTLQKKTVPGHHHAH